MIMTAPVDEYDDLCHEFDTDDPCGCHVGYQWMIGCQNRCDKCKTCFACKGMDAKPTVKGEKP